MRIVREVMPNGMPLVIQGVLNDRDEIEPDSVAVYPLMKDSSFDEDKHLPEAFLLSKVSVMPKLPVSMGPLGKRLVKQLTRNCHDINDS